MNERVLFTVGSILRGDDAAGPVLAKMVEEMPGDVEWTVVDGAQTPEDDLGYIRDLAPCTIVLVDAAEMGLEPGAVMRLRATDVSACYKMSTHALPMTIVLEELNDIAQEVVFLGIQPAGLLFFDPLDERVSAAVKELHRVLTGEDEGWERYPFLDAPVA